MDKNIADLVLNLGKSERKEAKHFLDAQEIKEEMEKSQKPKETITITDFTDKRVKPFDAKSVYTVFNRKNKTTSCLNGEQLASLFIADRAEYNSFNNKALGSETNVQHFRIFFKNYTIKE